MSDRPPLLAAVGLVAVGLGAIAASAAVTPDGLVDGERLAATMLRATIAALGGYAMVLGGLVLTAIVLGWGRGFRWAFRLGAARLGLAATIGAASLGAAAFSSPPPAAAADTTSTSTTTSAPPAASLRPIQPPVASLIPLPAEGPASPAEEPSASHRVWTVEQGEHLWAIAEAALTVTHPDADDHDIHDYWIRLVELNEDRLVVPGEPDLIIPGQELLLPEP